MSEPARKSATYQDLLNAPDDMIAEILDGELILHPRPGPFHSSSATVIGASLGPLFLGRRGGGPAGGWRVHFEPELHLGDQVLVPDIAGWRWSRMPRLPRQAFFTLPPDWACEVLSPRTEQIDRTKKMRIYARHRVEYLWLVNPMSQTLEVFYLVGDFWQQVAVHAGLERVRVPPFPDLELDLGDWWDELEDETDG